jgi:sugar phosphate permease
MLAYAPTIMGEGPLSRRWTLLLPVIFITYSLAYLDRANFSFAAAGGMAKDLGITAAENSLLGALFFLGYFLFQIPGAAYAQKYSVKKLILVGLLGWGLLATATGLLHNLNALYGVRFALGIVESAVLPAMLILQARWYTRKERARANAFLVLGNPVTMLWMAVLSGYLIQNFGWREMFIVEGIPAVLWGIVWWKVVADRPQGAPWLPAAERQALEAQLAEEQRDIPPVKNYAAAFTSPRVLVLTAVYFLWSVGVYGFVIWLPSILRRGEISMIEVGWLSAVPYLAAIVAEIAASTWSDKTGKRIAVTWPCFLIAAAAFYGSYLLGEHHFWASFVLLVIAGAAMYAPYGPFFAYIPDILPSNVSGGAIALINSFGALGSFVGAYGVGLLNGATGNPGMSYLLMAAALIASAGIMFFMPERPALR